MRVKTVYIPYMSENCYVLETDSAAVFVDPGDMTDELKGIADRTDGKERMIILTHCHFDHIYGLDKLKERLDCEVAIGKDELENYLDNDANMCERVGLTAPKTKPDILLADGDVLTVGDINLKVIHTAGHTSGSVCYLTDNALISGDTIFAYDVGRTDLKSGDSEQLKNSMVILSKLDKSLKIYPGHGVATTLESELMHNAFLRKACL